MDGWAGMGMAGRACFWAGLPLFQVLPQTQELSCRWLPSPCCPHSLSSPTPGTPRLLSFSTGLALLHGVPLGFHLASAFYKGLAGQRVAMDDLQEADPQVRLNQEVGRALHVCSRVAGAGQKGYAC